MPLAPQQIRKLRARLQPRHVRSRETEGRTIAYLEGWHVIAEANRIFGFDGWDRELIESACVYTKQQGDRFNAAYTARIRIKVRAGEHLIVREGSGAGEANAASPGQAHELAMKAAETDATKRALMTFGNPFGLSLYGPAKEMASAKASTSSPRDRTGRFNGHAAHPVNPVMTLGTERIGHENMNCVASAATAPNSNTDGLAVPNHSDPVNQTARHDAKTEAVLDNDATGKTSALHSGTVTDVVALTEEDPAGERGSNPLGLPTERLKIDKSVLALAEPKRIRDQAHLRFVASRPCLICGRNKAQAHHLRFAQPKAMGRKVSDEYTVPLCSMHHRLLHQTGNEIGWWEYQQIDPLKSAAELWRRSRNEPPAYRAEFDQAPSNSG